MIRIIPIVSIFIISLCLFEIYGHTFSSMSRRFLSISMARKMVIILSILAVTFVGADKGKGAVIFASFMRMVLSSTVPSLYHAIASEECLRDLDDGISSYRSRVENTLVLASNAVVRAESFISSIGDVQTFFFLPDWRPFTNDPPNLLAFDQKMDSGTNSYGDVIDHKYVVFTDPPTTNVNTTCLYTRKSDGMKVNVSSTGCSWPDTYRIGSNECYRMDFIRPYEFRNYRVIPSGTAWFGGREGGGDTFEVTAVFLIEDASGRIFKGRDCSIVTGGVTNEVKNGIVL